MKKKNKKERQKANALASQYVAEEAELGVTPTTVGTIDESSPLFAEEKAETSSDALASAEEDPKEEGKDEEAKAEETTVVSTAKTPVFDDVMYSAAFWELESYLTGKADEKNKEDMIIFICVSALGEAVCTAFGKTLEYDDGEMSFLTDASFCSVGSASLGCIILSSPKEGMPDSIRMIKDIWIQLNGGYASVFKNQWLKKEDKINYVSVAMINARTYFTEDSMKKLKSAITDNITSMTFASKDKQRVKSIDVLLSFVAPDLYSYFPDSLTIRDAAKRYAISFVRPLFIVSLAFILFLSVVGVISERGFLNVLTAVILIVSKKFFKFFFGKGFRNLLPSFLKFAVPAALYIFRETRKMNKVPVSSVDMTLIAKKIQDAMLSGLVVSASAVASPLPSITSRSVQPIENTSVRSSASAIRGRSSTRGRARSRQPTAGTWMENRMARHTEAISSEEV